MINSIEMTMKWINVMITMDSWEPAMSYIESQYDRYLKEEQSTDRGRFISDSRIHCCLYFIAPTGHNLPALDLQVLKRLNGVVNVIPVIAKADSLTMEVFWLHFYQ